MFCRRRARSREKALARLWFFPRARTVSATLQASWACRISLLRLAERATLEFERASVADRKIGAHRDRACDRGGHFGVLPPRPARQRYHDCAYVFVSDRRGVHGLGADRGGGDVNRGDAQLQL